MTIAKSEAKSDAKSDAPTDATEHLQFYDLVTADGVPLSPWCWHVKMAMAHKGITPQTLALTFTEKDQVIAAGGKSYPLLVDGQGQVFDDSRLILTHLEALQPDPTLFPGGDAGWASFNFIHRYAQTILFPTLIKMILVDIPNVLTPEDRDYFIASREKRFGMSLEDFCRNRGDLRPQLSHQFDPFRKAMMANGYIAGKAPAMVDYTLFGLLQWARVTSPFQLYQEDDAIHPWMEDMLDRFDGLGRKAAACA